MERDFLRTLRDPQKTEESETEGMAQYFMQFNQIMCAAADLSRQPRPTNKPDTLPGTLGTFQRILTICSEVKLRKPTVQECSSRVKEIEALLTTLSVPFAVPAPKFRVFRNSDTAGVGAAFGTWIKEVKSFLGRVLISRSMTIIGGKVILPPSGSQIALEMNTKEILGAVTAKGGGGPIDGFIIDGVFESDPGIITETVKSTQQELGTIFWSPNLLRLALTEEDSENDLVRAKDPAEAAKSAQDTISNLELLIAAMTPSTDRNINLIMLSEHLKLSKYKLVQSIEDDIRKTQDQKDDGWAIPADFATKLFQAAQDQDEAIIMNYEDRKTRNLLRQCPRVAELCKGINLKEMKLEWPMLKRAIKEDGFTLDQFSNQADKMRSEWMSQLDNCSWRPSNRKIEKLLLVADAVEEVKNTIKVLSWIEKIAIHARPASLQDDVKHREIGTAIIKCLEPPTSAEELRKMFMRMPSGKTGGPSGTTREHYVHLPDFMLGKLLPLVRRIFEGQSPDRLRLGVISPLLKNDHKYRPVTLLEPLWKCCMTRVSDELLNTVAKHKILNDA
jgi:hypothetical protein